MSDIMKVIPFDNLMDWVMAEYETKNTIFGVHKIYSHQGEKSLVIFGEKLETPFGPAAGPHTQLAQNLIASYAGGSRFFELKTVQILEGEQLGIQKPCILTHDEAYNTEWSTELKIPEAMAEYIKGWVALKLISKEYGLGSADGFIFNMSVGYNLEGIKSEKVNNFIEGLKDATNTDAFKECIAWAKSNLHRFKNIDEEFINSISPKVCTSITLSTMHGCPSDEIERIVSYLLKEKKLNTYLKCNPTLLGYDFVRNTLDSMGYDYIAFDDHHFKADLQFSDAVDMLKKLMDLGKENNLEFGAKLTNTFPVKIMNNELAGSDMYMSGKSLYPLTISVAEKLETAFNGTLPISYSGGADINNIAEIYDSGIWPITVCTVLLRTGGYNLLKPMAEKLAEMPYENLGISTDKIQKLATKATSDKNYMKTPVKAKAARENKCIACVKACNNCVDVCPNRANLGLKIDGKAMLLHVDMMCNECGNCTEFCPFQNTPYHDKFTLFNDTHDLNDSKNDGFVVMGDGKTITLRLDGAVNEIAVDDIENSDVKAVVNTIIRDYKFCL